jgi:hypothetical protein
MSKDIELCLDIVTGVNEGEIASVMASDLGKIIVNYTALGETNFVFNLINRGIAAGDLVILEDGRVTFKNDLDNKIQ